MTFVPAPERVPTHDPDVVPATPWGPSPEHADLPVRPGDLQIGSYGSVIWRDKAVRRRKKFPIGFRAEEYAKERRGT